MSPAMSENAHKSFINMIEDPKVREWIREFVDRPHPDRVIKKKRPRGNPNLTKKKEEHNEA